MLFTNLTYPPQSLAILTCKPTKFDTPKLDFKQEICEVLVTIQLHCWIGGPSSFEFHQSVGPILSYIILWAQEGAGTETGIRLWVDASVLQNEGFPLFSRVFVRSMEWFLHDVFFSFNKTWRVTRTGYEPNIKSHWLLMAAWKRRLHKWSQPSSVAPDWYSTFQCFLIRKWWKNEHHCFLIVLSPKNSLYSFQENTPGAWLWPFTPSRNKKKRQKTPIPFHKSKSQVDLVDLCAPFLWIPCKKNANFTLPRSRRPQSSSFEVSANVRICKIKKMYVGECSSRCVDKRRYV